MDFKEKYLFIVYFSVTIERERFYKSILGTETRGEAKELFLKKINKDLKGFSVNNVKVIKINKEKYKGKKLSDKEWESLKSLSYPNTRHRLLRLKKDAWFKKQKFKYRNLNGTFKKGFTPWNKNLKLKMVNKDRNGLFSQARDGLGRFLDGVKPITIGAKYEEPKKTTPKKDPEISIEQNL